MASYVACLAPIIKNKTQVDSILHYVSLSIDIYKLLSAEVNSLSNMLYFALLQQTMNTVCTVWEGLWIFQRKNILSCLKSNKIQYSLTVLNRSTSMSDTLADTPSWGENTTGTDIKAWRWYLAGLSTIRKLCDSSAFLASVQSNISTAFVWNFDPKGQQVMAHAAQKNFTTLHLKNGGKKIIEKNI